MFNNYGDYQIIFRAKKHYNDSEKEVVIVVDANSESQAKNKAGKQAKSLGYNYCEIISTKLLQRKQKNDAETKSSNLKLNGRQKKGAIIIGVVAFAVLVLIFVLVASGIIK